MRRAGTGRRESRNQDAPLTIGHVSRDTRQAILNKRDVFDNALSLFALLSKTSLGAMNHTMVPQDPHHLTTSPSQDATVALPPAQAGAAPRHRRPPTHNACALHQTQTASDCPPPNKRLLIGSSSRRHYSGKQASWCRRVSARFSDFRQKGKGPLTRVFHESHHPRLASEIHLPVLLHCRSPSREPVRLVNRTSTREPAIRGREWLPVS